MKIPKSVMVGGHRIRIKIRTSKDVNGPGDYNDYHGLIRIRGEFDIPESSQAETLLHEIIECIRAKNNLELDHTVLTVISESLFAVIRNNNLDFRNKS